MIKYFLTYRINSDKHSNLGLGLPKNTFILVLATISYYKYMACPDTRVHSTHV